MNALRVVGEFEWTFNMQRNAKPNRPHPFQGKDVLYSQEDKTADNPNVMETR